MDSVFTSSPAAIIAPNMTMFAYFGIAKFSSNFIDRYFKGIDVFRVASFSMRELLMIKVLPLFAGILQNRSETADSWRQPWTAH